MVEERPAEPVAAEPAPPHPPKDKRADPVPVSDADRWRDALRLTILLLGLIATSLLVGLAPVLLAAGRDPPGGPLREELRAVMALRAGLPEPARLDALAAALRSGTERPWQPIQEARAAARATHAQLLAILPAQDLRRGALAPCLDLLEAPAGATRTERLNACVIVVEGLQRQIASLPDADTLKQTLELRKLDIESQRAAATTVTQFALAVLGLLVPILTALLGYMFGARSLQG